MTYSNLSIDRFTPLVLDTSVLINLHASGRGARVLDAIPNEIFVPEAVRAELDNERSKMEGGQHFIRSMVSARRIQCGGLSERESRLFMRLVTGTYSLSDGEAATIAVAACRCHLPVVDERKGRHQAQVCLGRRPLWSLDLLVHRCVVAVLGTSEATEAVYLALRDGRMRVAESECEMVVRMIGTRRALECRSLPGYKARRDRWMRSLSGGKGIEHQGPMHVAVCRGA